MNDPSPPNHQMPTLDRLADAIERSRKTTARTRVLRERTASLRLEMTVILDRTSATMALITTRLPTDEPPAA